MSPNDLLRDARIAQNWRQQDVANQVGTTVVTVNRWERGSQQPGAYFRVKLCALFGKSAEELGLLPKETEVQTGAQEDSSSPQVLEECSPSKLCLWTVPYQQNPFFTGRETLLQAMDDLLHQSAHRKRLQTIALCGMAGAGKTQTLVEYLFRSVSAYTALLWITAETEEAMSASILQLLPQLDEEVPADPQPQAAYMSLIRWLKTHEGWLLVLDNVEEKRALHLFLSSLYQGTIVVTTRLHTLDSMLPLLDVPPFTSEEGMAFLLARTRKKRYPLSSSSAPVSETTTALRTLVQELGGLPLALDQAAVYIARTGCSFKAYVHFFQHDPLLLLGDGIPGTDYPGSVFKTFALCFEQMTQQHPLALPVLLACTYFFPDAIPEVLVKNVAMRVSSTLASHPLNPFSWNALLAVLQSASLLQRQAETNTLSVHRLVQQVLHVTGDHSMRQALKRHTVEAVSQAFPRVEDIVSWITCQHLLPHALRCASLIEEEGFSSVEAGWLLHQLGGYLLEQAQYVQAEHWTRLALAIRCQALGAEHPEVAATLNNLAEGYYFQGAYARAEPLYLQALKLRQKQLGEGHLEVAISLNNLAGLYSMQGRYSEALSLYRQVLQTRERLLNPIHVDVAEIYHNLGYLYQLQGDLSAAEAAYQQALDRYQRSVGYEHAYLIKVLCDLGTLSLQQQRLTQATALVTRACMLGERHLSELHPRKIFIKRTQAFLFSAQGRYSQAEEYLRQVLILSQKVFGLKHPRTIACIADFAQFFAQQHRFARAERLYLRALSLAQHVLGPAHPSIADLYLSLATLSKEQAQSVAAKTYYRRAQTLYEQIFGSDHPKVQEMQKSLRTCEETLE